MLSTRKQSGPPVRLGTNEDKDVLIGCLCLFCFCGWEIRSGLELRKWKGLTGNEYCDHRAVWHKCVQRLRYAGAPAELMKPEILRDIFEIEAEFFTGKDGLPYCMPTASARKDAE